MLIHNNTLSLNIVKQEIDITLKEAGIQLEAFDENRRDTQQLSNCIDYFNQLKGTFEIICMPGASLLCEAMADTSDLLLKQSDEQRDQTLAQITSGIIVLSRYIEYVLLTQNGLPELLFTSINDLRQTCKKPALPESSFFDIELSETDLERLAAAKLKPSKDGGTKRLRHMYQVGLLGSFKEENLKTNFKMMARALTRLNDSYDDDENNQLLNLCNGVLDALLEGNMSLNKQRKLVLGRIDRQVKLILESPEELDTAAIMSLAKDCLYIIALSEPATDRITSIKKEFDLERFHLNEKIINQERELMTGPSASVITAVAGALKEDIAVIKDKLDVLARDEGKIEELVELKEPLKKIVHTLIMLGLPSASKRLNALVDSIQEEQGNKYTQTILDLADVLVYIEHAMAKMERSHSVPIANDSDDDEEDMLDLDNVFRSVVIETRKSISEIQRTMSDYVEEAYNKTTLALIPDMLTSAWGGAFFLNVERIPGLLKRSGSFVDGLLENSDNPEINRLDVFADALASMDYYLESLEDKKPIGGSILDVAEDSLQELGYAA